MIIYFVLLNNLIYQWSVSLFHVQVLESINLVLVVGLAVDYCVHIAESYTRSVYNRRDRRVYDTLEKMALPVVSGAATTLGAAFFLFFTKISFFVQFGAFMFCTIGFSLVYALGFLVVALCAFGPENDQGKIRHAFRAVRKCSCMQHDKDFEPGEEVDGYIKPEEKIDSKSEDLQSANNTEIAILNSEEKNNSDLEQKPDLEPETIQSSEKNEKTSSEIEKIIE